MKQLEELNFSPAARIHVHETGMTFELLDEKFRENTGMVYAWVHEDEIMYIGKAGKGIRKRLTEHRGGMSARHGSGTGFRNRNLILDIGGTINVWGRVCNKGSVTYTDVLGNEVTKTVTMEAEEEDQLMGLLQPKWNSAGMAKHKKA